VDEKGEETEKGERSKVINPPSSKKTSFSEHPQIDEIPKYIFG